MTEYQVVPIGRVGSPLPERADRGVLVTRPRSDPARIVSTEGLRIQVRPLEALDGTPVLDVTPVLDPGVER